MTTQILKPVSIDLVSDDVLTISWSDGHQSVYFVRDLRKKCPCARCEKDTAQDSSNPLKMIKKIPDRITLKGWNLIGRYAIGFHFSDGHKSGIYSYEYLRSICQCDECDHDTIRIQGPLRLG